MPSALDTICNLLANEANELSARAAHDSVSDVWKPAYRMQARGVQHALEIVQAIQSGVRPFGGIRSCGAHYFYIHGELLPVGSDECLPAMPVEGCLEDGSRVQFYAVQQLEADEFGVVDLRSKSPVPVVGDDDSVHGDSCFELRV